MGPTCALCRGTPKSSSTSENVDFDHLLRSNLLRVFNERDAAARAAAVKELFDDRPTIYEPQGMVEGQEAIVKVAGDLLVQFGPKFAFHPVGAAVGHHGVATLRWVGEDGGNTVVSGFDTAEVVDGRISRLWVLIQGPET